MERRTKNMRQATAPGEVKPKRAPRTGQRSGAALPQSGWSDPEIEKAARRTLERNREAITELAKW
jgi:hypothetical protein